MFDLFFGKNFKRLERLIMATRTELVDKIAELSASVSDEASQVKGAVEALEAVIKGLEVKVADLEVQVGTAGDYTAELASLAKVRSAIAAIYEPAPVA